MLKELQVDTLYHTLISIAVILKIILIFFIGVNLYEKYIRKIDTPLIRKTLKIKNQLEEWEETIICFLMIILFFPRNKTYCIDHITKLLLFSYAMITLLGILGKNMQ